MVKRVFDIVYKEVRGLHQAAYVLGFFALGSQLLAIVRDRLLAHQFGAGMELDVYYAAFRIPDVLYVLFASTLSVYVLIPFVSARIKKDDSTQAQALLSSIFGAFLIVYTLLALVIFLFAPYIIPKVFPGLNDHMDTLIMTTRILLLQPLLLGVSSLFGVVTQLSHRFVLYAISPLLYNLGIIFGITFLYPYFGISGLAYGVLLGAFGHMVVQIPFVRKSSLSIVPTMFVAWREVLTILRISIPRALTLALGQLVFLCLLGIASVMTVGSVSVFQLAFNLQSVPLAIIGASYSIAAFPYLADLFAQKRMEAFGHHIVTALRHILFWSIPTIALFVVLRAHVVRVVLGSGEFGWTDTRLTSAVLAILTLSLVAQAVYLLLVRSFYAAGNTRVPFIVTVFGSALTVGLSFFLYKTYLTSPELITSFESLLRLEGVAGSEIIVLALGYSLAVTVQTLVLGICAFVSFNLPTSWLVPHLFRSICAAIVGAAAAYVTLNFFREGINETAFLGILIQGFLGGVIGILGIVLTYFALKSPELHEIYASFHSKVFRTDVVAPQEDIL
jgi:putative peptidoglycan lipid II flippase